MALVGLLALAACPAFVARGERPNPIESRAELVASDLYDVAQWAKRVPYEIAMPIVARSKIRSFIAELDLEPAVRDRLLRRVDSRSFVDELVPFALALRDVYLPSEEYAPQSFDEWLRQAFDEDEPIPGFEHSMFAWKPAAESTGAAFDDRLAARLVALYDALYLQDADSAAAPREQLICARRNSDRARAPAAERVRPIVRDLLADVRGRVQAGGELAATLDGVLTDARKLDAVSISLVHFLDALVCRHYRVFATRVWREEQLARWMTAELDEPGGGRLWSYLEAAQNRRYAALVVVDGLQGRLVESLAAAQPEGFFLEQILREQEVGKRSAPRTQPSTKAPPQQTRFLRRIASAGFADRRYLGFFAGVYENPGGIAEVGGSTTPTISVRNLPIAQTGAAVAGAGGTQIPNFHFLDRHSGAGGRAYYFYGNDALQLDSLARRAGMRTLYDRLPTMSSFSCAGQYDDGAHYRLDSLINLALGEKMRDFGELRCMAELRRRAAVEPKLRQLRQRLLDKRDVLDARFGFLQVWRRLAQSDERALAVKLVREIAALDQQAMPQLLVYYNPWPDHFAHFTGPFADEILAPSGELNRLDYWLGVLSQIYRDAGVAERTLFAMAGDHGLAPVFHMLNPEVEVFDRLRRRGFAFAVEKISSDEGEGPKLTDPLRPPPMRDLDAVVASTAGGNYMIDLFADQQANWARQPTLAELRQLRLVDGGGPIDIVEEIYRALSESLDYMVVRVETCDADGGVVAVIGPRRGHRGEAIVERRGDRIFVDDPHDLLDARSLTPYEDLDAARRARHAALVTKCLDGARRDDRTTWCDEGQWRLLASYTPRPDAAVQLAHLYDTDRAGTINLFPRAGVGYNTVVPGRHAGELFHEKDAFVGVWGDPVRRAQRPRATAIGAIPASVYAYLSGESVSAGRGGWGYDPIPLQTRLPRP